MIIRNRNRLSFLTNLINSLPRGITIFGALLVIFFLTGIQGQGALLVLRRPAGGNGPLSINHVMNYSDALFDLSFSESDPRVVCAAAADGHIVMFNSEHGAVLGSVKGHAKEVGFSAE